MFRGVPRVVQRLEGKTSGTRRIVRNSHHLLGNCHRQNRYLRQMLLAESQIGHQDDENIES